MISTRPGLARFLRTTPSGLLRLDAAKVAADAKLDGKYLLRTSDPHLSTEDIALGYKQLLEVERGWRDMKQILDLRPVYPPARGPHPRPRTAVLARPAPGPSRRDPHHHPRRPGHQLAPRPRQLQRLHVGLFTGPAGTFRQTTAPTDEARRLHTALTCRCRPGSCTSTPSRRNPLTSHNRHAW